LNPHLLLTHFINFNGKDIHKFKYDYVKRWAGHVACMGKKRIAYGVFAGKPEVDYLEDLEVDGRIILKWSSKK